MLGEECARCKILEAYYNAERVRSAEFHQLFEDQKDLYNDLLKEYHEFAGLRVSPASGDSPEQDLKPFGGTETLRGKTSRKSRESKLKLMERKKHGSNEQTNG